MMKIMTFNLRADNILDLRNRWSKRSKIVAHMLESTHFDFIGLQEVTPKMYQDIAEYTSAYTSIGEGRTKKLFNEQNNLLINNAHKIIENETFWLSKTPHKAGSSIWYSLFPRICTTAVIELDTHQKVRVYNTHLDCILPHAREKGLKTILAAIEAHHDKEQLPCVLMGDFNATPESKLIKQFSKGAYSHKRFIAVQDFNKEMYKETTMGMFKGRDTGMHIDYIFVSEEFEMNDVQIYKYNESGRYPSDHYPIIADLKI